MADTNRAQLSFAKENAWGLFPTAAGTPQINLRFTSESFGFNVANIQSAEIRSDRQVTDLIQTGADCSGGFNFELSYDDGGFGELFKGALWSSGWSTAIQSTKTSLEMDPGATYGYLWTLAYDSLASFDTGQWIKISGFSTTGATAANNGCYFIVARRTTGLDVLPNVPVATTSTNNNTLWVQGSYVRNGTTESSYSFERYHTDVTQYFDYTGLLVNTFSVTAAANAIVTGSFDFIGKEATRAATSGTAIAKTDAGTADVFNGVSNVARVMEGFGTSFSTIDSDLIVQQISFTLTNNVRGISGIGFLGFADVGVGVMSVTGNLNAYFKDGTFYDTYIAATDTGFSFELTDNDDNTYIFTFPKIKIATDTINVSGQNADVVENMTWQAVMHPTLLYTMQVDKMPAI